MVATKCLLSSEGATMALPSTLSSLSRRLPHSSGACHSTLRSTLGGRRSVLKPCGAASFPTPTVAEPNPPGEEDAKNPVLDALKASSTGELQGLPEVPVPVVVEEEAEKNWFQKFWASYNEELAKNPIPVKSATSFFGFLLGDICAQLIIGEPYDPYRTMRMTAFGVMMDGPIGHCWYTLLDKNVMPEDPKSTKAILSKTALDQLIWAPFFSCVFFTFVRTLEGHPELALLTIQRELVPTIVANYALWPLAHLINFRFVPSEQRILYINAVQILWTSYLSNLAAHGHGMHH